MIVAEGFRFYNEVFKYAETFDLEARRMKRFSHEASQVGATKTLLQDQALMTYKNK